MIIRLDENTIRHIFSSQPSRLDRILEHRLDLFTALASATGRARHKAIQLLGDRDFRNLSTRSTRFNVSPAQARRVLRFFKDGPIFGQDIDVVAEISRRGLGDLLQSDHLIEQRFLDAIVDGNVFLNRRVARQSSRNPERINDALALAVPQNEIIFYRIAKEGRIDGFGLAGLYPHVGPGSKTTRMSQFIPVGTEATHSLRDISNAHRWVLREQGLPTDFFEDALFRELAEALELGMEHDRTLRQSVGQILGSRPTTENIIQHLQGGPQLTADIFSPANWTRYREIEMPLHL